MLRLDSVHIYPSNMRWENRIRKITTSLISQNLQKRILLIGLADGGEHQCYKYLSGTVLWLVGVPSVFGWSIRSRLIRLIYLYIVVLKRLRPMSLSYINPHSLTTLPLAVLCQFSKRDVKIIYDTHELEIGAAHYSSIRRVLLKLVEKSLVQKVKYLVTVNPSISQWYTDTYSLNNVYTMLNVPDVASDIERLTKLNSLEHAKVKTELRFCYHGVLDAERFTSQLVRVFSSHPELGSLTFIGFGKLEEFVREAAKENENIFYCPPKPIEKLLPFINSFDIGFSLTDPEIANHRFSLPNKFFESLLAGLPVIVCSGGDTAELVSRYEIGWTYDSGEQDLAKFIASIGIKDWSQKVRNVDSIRKLYSWKNEEKVLHSLYGGK